MLPTKYLVNWPFGLGEEAKSTFSRWRPSWISDQNDFSYCSTRHFDTSNKVSSQLTFRFRRRSELDFQNSSHGGHLGFLIGSILAISYLQVTLVLPTRIQVNWPFGSGEEAKNRFSRWRLWRPSWISDRNYFSYFWSTSHSNASYQFQVNWPFSLEEDAKNKFSRRRPWRPSWISDRNNFSYFWSTSHPNASYQVSNQMAGRSRRRRENRFSRRQPFRTADWNDYSHFCSSRLRCFLPSSMSVGLSLQEKKRIRFSRQQP